MSVPNTFGDKPANSKVDASELDENFASLGTELTESVATLNTAIGGKSSLGHEHVVAEVTDLPSVTSLRDLSVTTGARGTDAITNLEARLAALEAAILPPPDATAPTENVALSLYPTTPNVGQTVTITPPTWNGSVTNVRYDIVLAGSIISTQTAVTFVPQQSWSGLTGYVVCRADWSGGTVTAATSVSFAVNASASTTYSETTVFSSTNSIKSLALDSAGTSMFIAESIVTGTGGGSVTEPTFRATNVVTALGTSGGNNTLTVSTSGFSNGDYVLLVLSLDYWTTVSVTWPEGATQLVAPYWTVGASDGQMYAVAGIVMSGSPANYTVSFPDLGDPANTWCHCLTAFAVTGQHATSPIDFVATPVWSAVFRASPINMPEPGVATLSGTTGFDNTMLVYIGAPNCGGYESDCTGQTPPTGFTERCDYVTCGWAPVTIATKVQATAGATGSITGATATLNDSLGGGFNCILLGIRGAASGGGTEESAGIIAKSARSGSTWAAKSTVYDGDGVADAEDEGWYTAVAVSSDGTVLTIGAASNGYAGPGYGTVLLNASNGGANEEQLQRWVGTFDQPAGTAWPDAIACSATAMDRVVLLRGSTNAIWSMHGTEVGAVTPITGTIGLTPTAFGNRIALKGDGLRMAVVTSTTVDLYSRSSVTTAWSKAASITPRNAATAISVALSRDGTTLAIGTTSGVDVYAIGTWPTYNWIELLAPSGGGYSQLGVGLALSNDGGMVIASEYTATDATDSVRDEKQSVVRTWIRGT